MFTLTLKRAKFSRRSGQWQEEDYDVLADGKIVGSGRSLRTAYATRRLGRRGHMTLLCRLLRWPRRVQEPRCQRDRSKGYAEVHALPAAHLSFSKVPGRELYERPGSFLSVSIKMLVT